MAVTYIVAGVKVDPNGKPVIDGQRAPVVTNEAFAAARHNQGVDVAPPSPGELSAASAKTAPDPSDFATEQEYQVAVQANEAEVQGQIIDERRIESGTQLSFLTAPLTPPDDLEPEIGEGADEE